MDKKTLMWLAIGAGVFLLFSAAKNSAASNNQTANADINTAQGAFGLLAQDLATLGTSLNALSA